MKKIILILLLGLILSACTKGQNPLLTIEDTVSESDSVTDIERDLKTNASKDKQAISDLTPDQLNSQNNPDQASNMKETTSQTKQINLTKEEITNMSENISLETSKGRIALKLFPEVAPETVKNFLTKAKSDYYKGLVFHRVEDWVIQGGDPLGTGTGGGKMPTELSDTPFVEGSLGVARGGDVRISNDSQFFICTKDCGWLTGQYTIFGQVTEGMDVVKNIQIGDTIDGITSSNEADK